MGESYRGLTIKIGGDTTNLSKALKSANSAIRQTQSELRKINQGLKFDSSNAKLIELKMTELGQKTGQVNTKLETMRKTLNSLKGTAVEKLAKESENLALAAEEARARYARVDDELARVYNSLEKVAAKNNVAFDSKKPDEMVADLRKLGLIENELYEKIQRLKKAHHEAFASNEIHKQALQYKDLTVEIAKTEAEQEKLIAQQTRLKADSYGKNRAEVKALRTELSQLEGTAGLVAREFRAMESAMKLNPDNVNAATAAYQALEQEMALARKRQESINQAMSKLEASGISKAVADTKTLAEQAKKAEDNYNAVSGRLGEISGQLTEARKRALELKDAAGESDETYKSQVAEVKRLEQTYDTLVQKVKEADAALNTAMGAQQMANLRVQAQEAANAVSRLEQQQRTLGISTGTSESALKSLGMTMYATVAPAFMTIGYKSIDAAETIDSAFRDMKKTVNGTEQDFDNLRQAALEFSRTHAVSADTILEIEAMGGQLGIAVDKLQDFGTVVSNLDIATNMNADEIAEDLGQLNNILPDLNDNYSAFGDALVRLGNNMPAQESAIMDVTSRIGSLGGIVGMSTPQVLAWATAIAATGQNSEAAGTAISNTMSDIEGAVASGGDSLEAFAQVAGMSAEDFAKSWNETPSDAMRAFVEGLHSIDEQGGSVDATLQELGITGVRQKQALEGLAQTTDVLGDALTMSEDAWNGVSDSWGDAGDAAREASQKSEGFSGTLQMLKNSASEFGYELGNAMVPFLQAATSAVQTLTDVFKDLPAPAQRAVVGMIGLGAASGVLVTGYSSLMPVIKSLSTSFIENVTHAQAAGSAYRVMGVNVAGVSTKLQTVTGSAKVASVATKGLAVSLRALQSVGAMIAITAVVEGISMLASQAEEAREKEEKMTQATSGLTSAVAGINSTDASSSLSSIGEEAESATESIDELAEAHSSLASKISESNSEVTATKGQLSEYQQVISELYGTTDDGAEGYGRLKAAVDGMNSSCGTNYTVVKNAAGAYTIMKDEVEQSKEAILNVIEAQKQQVEAEALLETTKELYKQKTQDQQAYAEQLKKTQDAWDAYSNAEGVSIAQKNDLYNAWERENNQLSENKKLLDSSSSAYDKASQQQSILTAAKNEDASANTKYVASCDELKAALMNASGSSTEFITAMDSAGISLQQLGDTNQEALVSLASAWDGNMSTIVAKAAELGDQLPQETQNAIYQAAVGMLNASPEVVSAAASACDMTQLEFAKFAQDAGLNGDKAMAIFTEAVQAGADPASTAAKVTEAAAADRLDELRNAASSAGNAGGNAFASAISNASGSANSSGTEVAESAGDGLQSQNDNASTWGADLGRNFASGLSGMADLASSAGSAIANAVASLIHFSEPEDGPWSGAERGGVTSGRHLVQNFAAGMIAELGTVSNASGSIAEAAADALQGIQDVPTLPINAVITDVAMADGVQLISASEAASLSASAARSSAAAANAAYVATASESAKQTVMLSASGMGNAQVIGALSELNSVLKAYTKAVESQETAVYVDSKKLASTIARPMNQQLGKLSRRGM